MNKNIRLAHANIRKHKIESFLMSLLVFLCVTVLGSALSAGVCISTMFDRMMERTGIKPCYVQTSEKNYDEHFLTFLAEDPRVTEYSVVSFLCDSDNFRLLMPDGGKKIFPVYFVTAEEDAKFEKTRPESGLNEAELAAIAHPIWLPHSTMRAYKLHEGDPFELVWNAKKFSFTVAGSYECGLFDSSMTKCIVTEQDYQMLKPIMIAGRRIYFGTEPETDEEDLIQIFRRKCMEYSEEDLSFALSSESSQELRQSFSDDIDLLLTAAKVMACIIFLAVAVMIRFRIVNDIRNQIVSIGVLEAIGYKSSDISLSYVWEYLLLSLAGCAAGIIGCCILSPVFVSTVENLAETEGARHISLPEILLAVLMILLFVTVIAFLRARAVRHYPPVRAFRKGIETHHFGRNYLPLRNTGKSVHLRIALKGFLSNLKQCFGLTAVMTVVTVGVLVCALFFPVFGRGIDGLMVLSGHEVSDVDIRVCDSTDAYAFAAELAAMPEVRKAMPSIKSEGEGLFLRTGDSDNWMYWETYDNFSDTENIFAASGRLPEHDNEIMLSKTASYAANCKVGDTVTLVCGSVEQQYLVTGLTVALIDGNTLFMTTDGYRRLNPLAKTNSVDVYLEKGTDITEFEEQIDRKYGKSVADSLKEQSSGGSLEERIRSAADQLIAEMMQSTDMTQLDYAIQIGDTVITGDNSNVQIRSISNMREFLDSALGSACRSYAAAVFLFALLSMIVTVTILLILTASVIRDQRRAFGIMKSIGYTNRELIFQLLFRIIPAAVIAVMIGTVIVILFVNTAWFQLNLLPIPVNYRAILCMDCVILLFCTVSTLIGAAKVREVSVCELMSE